MGHAQSVLLSFASLKIGKRNSFVGSIQLSEIFNYSLAAIAALSFGIFFCYKFYKSSKNSEGTDPDFSIKVGVLFFLPILLIILSGIFMPKLSEFDSSFGHVLFRVYVYFNVALVAYVVPALVAFLATLIIEDQTKAWLYSLNIFSVSTVMILIKVLLIFLS